MKIANIIEDARLAGPQRRMVNVATRLSEHFEHVILIPETDNSDFRQLLEEHSLNWYALPLHHLTLKKIKLAKFLLFFVPETIKLKNYLKENNIDIIHVSGGSWQWKGVIAGRLAGCRVLWHLNDTKMNVVIKRIFWFLAGLTDGLIVAGEEVKNVYVGMLGNRYSGTITSIPAPVDQRRFNPVNIEKIPELRKDGVFTIAMVANVSPVKGLETLIKAAQLLNRLNTKAIWYVAGPIYDSQKNYKARLDNLMNSLSVDNVIFLGGYENVPGFLKTADVYVCTSVAEASPTSVWEAMFMSLPVVSTKVGDVPYHIESGHNGFVCEIDDAQSIASNIHSLLNDQSMRAEFGSRSRTIALEKFELGVVVEKHEQVYESFG